MRKIFIIFIIAVLMLSGCGGDKEEGEEQSNAATPQVQQSPEQASTTNTPEPTLQTFGPTPSAQPQGTVSAEQTQQELQELKDALDELTGGDFSDIDYSE